MQSRVFTGEVMHARLTPARHVFRYPVLFFSFDLDELDSLNRLAPLAGYNRTALVSVRDSDHLRGAGSLKERALAIFRSHGIVEPIDRIELVTGARYLGHAFNPVKFYYGYRRDGSLAGLIAEVNNTFGERHLYVMANESAPRPGFLAHLSTAKAFHVSPFNDRQGHYTFDVSPIGSAIDLRIDLHRDGNEWIKTRLAGTGSPLSRTALAKAILTHPLAILLTLPRIHWEAARLYFVKGLRIFTKPVPCSNDTIQVKKPSISERLAMRLVLPYLDGIRQGCLRLTLPDGSLHTFGTTGSGHEVDVQIRDYGFFKRVLRHGEIGFGESYMHGEWDTRDVAALIKLFLDNRSVFERQDAQQAWAGRVFNWILHRLRPNTVEGSRRNIEAHYDLSNDFYRLFLDPSMMYSCALWHRPEESLEEAQVNKLRALIEKAGIRAEHHVLEIGSGWGAFAIEAVRSTGCRVTTITISQQQFDLATQRIREAGLADRIAIRLCDYRHVEGQFDRVVSIEMIEAVGHEFLGDYFGMIDRVLKPGGVVALQVITIPDTLYDNYRKTSDWIRKHIFPGGHLPSLGAMQDALAARSRLAVSRLDTMGVHYARTLREWRERFVDATPDVAKLGFDETFRRKWVYYLAYCEAAFATRTLDTVQVVLTPREG